MSILKSVIPILLLISSAAESKPFHNEISTVFRGSWAPHKADCVAAMRENVFSIDSESVNYYEGNDYLLLGIEFF